MTVSLFSLMCLWMNHQNLGLAWRHDCDRHRWRGRSLPEKGSVQLGKAGRSL